MGRKPAKKRSYHHGDLRAALLGAAERLMASSGDWTFTLREVAREAGVSHNAPYNHFADKQALLEALACRGFEALRDVLQRPVHDPSLPDATARMLAAANAYVDFALRESSRFKLMFSAELAMTQNATLRAAGEAAYACIKSIIRDGAEQGVFRTDVVGTHPLAAWSMVHGLSVLLINQLVTEAKDVDVRVLTQTVVNDLVIGLKLGAR